MYRATAHLGELRAPGKQLCFYPSCGNRLLSPLMALKSDVFVFSDHYARTPEMKRQFWGRIVREFAAHGVPLTPYKATKNARVAKSAGKWLFLFFHDNNMALKFIAGAGWRISQFVGLNDGCCEGGNYECVHADPFLGRLLAKMKDGADYFTDHSDALTTPNPLRSSRSHALFKNHFVHESGRSLHLSRILIVRGLTTKTAAGDSLSEPEVFQPPACLDAPRPPEWRSIEEKASIELSKFIPFRTLQHTGIIAHYHVAGAPTKTTAEPAAQTNHGSPDRTESTGMVLTATPTPPDTLNSLRIISLSTAADPSTPPAILSQMASKCGDDDGLCETLALNPNTPLPDLFNLWRRKPLAALENPILTFLTFQNGKVLHQIVPCRVQHELYVALRSAGRDTEIEEHLPVKARLEWFNTQEPGTEFYHRCLEPELQQPPLKGADYERRKREDIFAQRLFTYLSTDSSPVVRKDMVSKLPTRFLDGYLSEHRADIRLLHAKRVTENHGGRSFIERQLLENLRDVLSQDPDESIRACIAEGSALENPLFERLARDTSLRVRQLLAGRKVPNDTRLCVEAWNVLAETSAEVARLVALNHACPFSLRLKLTEHPDLKVRKNAWSVIVFKSGKGQIQLLRRVEQLLERPHKHPELRTIAANKTIPSALAARFAKEIDPLPRIVSANPRLQERQRRRLLSEGDHRAARAALEHATGNEILWEALRHPSPAVRAALVKKKGVHASRIRFLLAKDPSFDVRHFLVSHLVDAKNMDESERKVVRPQVELVLSSATAIEKQGLLYIRPLRKLLALWKTRDSLNHLAAKS